MNNWTNSLAGSLLGRLRYNSSLANRCWFKVGGEAEYLYIPKNIADLQNFMQLLPVEIPLFILGVGSNILVRDGGLDGIVLRLGSGFTEIKYLGDGRIFAGAGALDLNVANLALENSIAGLEFLATIPGTIGGALAMNAGAHGREISDILESVEMVGRDGEIISILMKDLSVKLSMQYRKCDFPKNAIFTSAIFKGVAGNKVDIFSNMLRIKELREKSQPIKERTGGSTFKNPVGYKAWQLIDDADCRGLSIGDAEMSNKHCNFMINKGNATASDLENLGEEIRKRVFAESGVNLEWEIKIIGKK